MCRLCRMEFRSSESSTDSADEIIHQHVVHPRTYSTRCSSLVPENATPQGHCDVVTSDPLESDSINSFVAQDDLVSRSLQTCKIAEGLQTPQSVSVHNEHVPIVCENTSSTYPISRTRCDCLSDLEPFSSIDTQSCELKSEGKTEGVKKQHESAKQCINNHYEGSESKNKQNLRQTLKTSVLRTQQKNSTSQSDASTSDVEQFGASETGLEQCPPHGAIAFIGRRKEMEDEVAVVPRFLTLPPESLVNHEIPGAPETLSTLHFFGVYDGHGGIQVAKFCKDHLHEALASEIRATIKTDALKCCSTEDSFQKQWEKIMNACFLRMDMKIAGEAGEMGEQSKKNGHLDCCLKPVAPETVGTTAVVAIVGAHEIIVANCGDSRAVLSRGGHAIALSVDHKPDREDEMNRIEAAGGRVICWDGYRVFGVLAMSRAIGDRFLKPYVIADPEVTYTRRSDDDDCLILASDGLWDVLTNDEVCEVARKRLSSHHGDNGVTTGSSSGSRCKEKQNQNAEAAASLLAKMALAKGSSDNISVIVVDLKDRNR